jgi:CRP-like cAMP-binding protein
VEISNDELKTGRRPAPPSERSLRVGEYLFHEGDKGREAHIVVEGEVSIRKGTGTEEVEITRLGPGAILGEMALLDGEPRSASAVAAQPTRVTVLSEATFQKIMGGMPSWLGAIVRSVVRRLRESDGRVNTHTVGDGEASVAGFLLLQARQSEDVALWGIEYFRASDEYQFLTRRPRQEFKEELQRLVRREMVELRQADNGNRVVFVPDISALALFDEYRWCTARGMDFPALKLDQTDDPSLKAIIELAAAAAGKPLGRDALKAELEARRFRSPAGTIAKLVNLELVTPHDDPNLWLYDLPGLRKLSLARRLLPRLQQEFA